jgi:hypothetical protein
MIERRMTVLMEHLARRSRGATVTSVEGRTRIAQARRDAGLDGASRRRQAVRRHRGRDVPGAPTSARVGGAEDRERLVRIEGARLASHRDILISDPDMRLVRRNDDQVAPPVVRFATATPAAPPSQSCPHGVLSATALP